MEITDNVVTCRTFDIPYYYIITSPLGIVVQTLQARLPLGLV